MNAGADVDPEILSRCSRYAGYVEAKLGFRNHWYPTLFSNELGEGEFKSHPILGDQLLLTRVDGVVHAVRDRCLHRGVAFSRKPECYKRGTLTCWYHGFTYRLDDGELVCGFSMGGGAHVTGGTHCARSTDGGRTWSYQGPVLEPSEQPPLTNN